MDWFTAGIAIAAFLAGLIVGRSLGGGSSTAQSDLPVPQLRASPGPVLLASGSHKVRLEACGENKIAVIKQVRAMTGLGLKEAKDLVERAPCDVATGVDSAKADQAVAVLNAAGARAIVT